MSILTYFGIILAAVLVYISLVFVIAWTRKRLDVVDIAWGGAFIVAALVSYALGQGGAVQLLATSLVIIWGLRLGYYIFRRVQHAPAEDERYTDMRKKWKGNAAVNAYVRIFIVQGVLATIVSASVIVINASGDHDIDGWATSGAIVWLVGFLFEAIGDAQLKKHLADPNKKGTLMTRGLWRFTRHPNYFGEATQWWGIFIIALGVAHGNAAIMSPLLITYLLLFVSGVPLTEKRFEGRPGWDEYKRRTSMFIPFPPKKL